MTKISLFFIALIFIGIHDVKCGKNKKKNIPKNKTKNKRVIKKNELKISQLLSEKKKITDRNNKEKAIKSEDKNATRDFDIDELRKNDEIYNSLQTIYDDRSKLNIKDIDVVNKIGIVKEINMSDNIGILDRKGLLVEKIFDGIKEDKLTAFSDSNLKIKITYETLKQRLIKPVILTNKRRKKNVQRYFKNSDIDNIEITGNIIWSKLLRDKILDYLVVKFSIPTSKSNLDNDITVCYLNYSDFIDYIRGKEIIAKTQSGSKMNLADIIINDKLNVMYTSVSDYASEYPITNSSFKENNFSAKELICELENKFYSYNAFL